MTVKLSELGFNGQPRIRDLWQNKELAALGGTFSPVINTHGAGLYRISSAK